MSHFTRYGIAPPPKAAAASPLKSHVNLGTAAGADGSAKELERRRALCRRVIIRAQRLRGEGQLAQTFSQWRLGALLTARAQSPPSLTARWKCFC